MWKLQDQSLMLIFASHKLVKEGFLDFFYYGNSNSVLRITFNNHSTTDKKREIWPVWLAHFSLWARNLGFSSLNTKTRDITADSHFKSPNRSSAKKKKKKVQTVVLSDVSWPIDFHAIYPNLYFFIIIIIIIIIYIR